MNTNISLADAFAQAIAHHQAGRLPDAELLYRVVLAAQPQHPDANHNMGVLAAQVGNPMVALPYFKSALEADPSRGQFWLSYIDALLLAGQYGDAQEVLAQGRKGGLAGHAVEALAVRAKAATQEGELFAAARVYQTRGMMIEAEVGYLRLLALNPRHIDGLVGLGGVYLALIQPKDADTSFRQVLEIKPDHVVALNCLGLALRELGRMAEAEASIRRSLEANPDNADTHCILGDTLRDQGQLMDAEACYLRALELNPNQAAAWAVLSNISLVINYLQSPHGRNEKIYTPKFTPAQRTTFGFALYEFSVGKSLLSDVEKLYRSAAVALPPMVNDVLPIGKLHRNKCETGQSANKFVALLHFGRSGTGLIHSLIDDHPEISSLPSIFLKGYFNEGVWENISAGGWKQLPERFADMFEVLFDAESPKPIPGMPKGEASYPGRSEGMNRVGATRNESVFIDRKLFCAEVTRQLKRCKTVDPITFFKIVHSAYEHCIGTTNLKHTIFYHIHNPTDYAMINYLRYAPNSRFIMMVRNPVKSCEAWVRFDQNNSDYTTICQRIVTMLFDIDKVVFRMHDSIGVRLEDLKQQPKKTIPALCAWLGIKETPSLYKMTAQGKKWWGDPSSPNYNKNKAMSPFGDESMECRRELFFSEADQFVLETLFYPFSVKFGYREPDPVWFKESLKAVRLQLDDLMDFEKVLSESMKLDPVQFKLKFEYLYLRAVLFARLDVLDEYGDYPHMLRPLDISGY